MIAKFQNFGAKVFENSKKRKRNDFKIRWSASGSNEFILIIDYLRMNRILNYALLKKIVVLNRLSHLNFNIIYYRAFERNT